MRAAALSAQTRTEVVLTLRRGESILLVVLIPVLLLVFFSVVDVLPTESVVGPGGDPVDFLAPGILALAIMSTAMVNLAIATGFERQYGVLKRLGVTPLGRPALLAAKAGAVIVVEVAQVVVIVAVALGLGWDPDLSAGAAVAAFVLGTVAFAGIGLTLAGTLRGETNLAAANGLYLLLLLLGGMVIPLTELPSWLEAVAKLLPAAALSAAVDGALTAGVSVPTWAWATLAAWAVAWPITAALTFRWE